MVVVSGIASFNSKMGGQSVAAAVHTSLTPTTNPPLPAFVSAAANVTATATAYVDKFDSRLEWYEDVIVGIFLILVGIMSLLGNGSSIIMFHRRLRHLTPAEVLLMNLAVMHLFIALFSYPAPMISSFSHRWIFGDIGCKLYGCVCYLLGVATITSMMALAVVRYLKTCSHTYSRTLTVQHMKVVLVGVYMYSLFWAVLPLFTFISDYEVEPFGTSCTLNWSNPANTARVYVMMAVALVVVVPSIVMFWCYARILLLVRRNHRKKFLMTKRNSASQGRSELQITLISWLVCVGFLVAWLPYSIVSVMYGLTGREAPVYASLAPVLLAKSSCAYNPVIYIFINARYRSEMLRILQGYLRPLVCFPGGEEERHHKDGDLDDAAEGSSMDMEMKSSSMIRINKESIVLENYLPISTTESTNLKPDLHPASDKQILSNSLRNSAQGVYDVQQSISDNGQISEHISNGEPSGPCDGQPPAHSTGSYYSIQKPSSATSSAKHSVVEQSPVQHHPAEEYALKQSSDSQANTCSTGNFHPLYHFPGQKVSLQLSCSDSHGHKAAKPSSEDVNCYEEVTESTIMSKTSVIHHEKESTNFSSLSESSNMLGQLPSSQSKTHKAETSTTVVSRSLEGDAVIITEEHEGPNVETSSADLRTRDPSPDQLHNSRKHNTKDDPQVDSDASIGEPTTLSSSGDLSPTDSSEEQPAPAENTSTENLVPSITVATEKLVGARPKRGSVTENSTASLLQHSHHRSSSFTSTPPGATKDTCSPTESSTGSSVVRPTRPTVLQL
ncbi:melanopsin-like [Homarus americanus]|uniref:melanopsin-like n=1 Tax=Homarus americanus TaxID=6706 RepID=UPI001C44F54E|nr:melanopsin-like [Homarus americanus]